MYTLLSINKSSLTIMKVDTTTDNIAATKLIFEYKVYMIM